MGNKTKLRPTPNVLKVVEIQVGQLEKQGTGNGNGNLHKKRTEMRRLVVEILFTNIPRNDSVLTAILFMN